MFGISQEGEGAMRKTHTEFMEEVSEATREPSLQEETEGQFDILVSGDEVKK